MVDCAEIFGHFSQNKFSTACRGWDVITFTRDRDHVKLSSLNTTSRSISCDGKVFGFPSKCMTYYRYASYSHVHITQGSWNRHSGWYDILFSSFDSVALWQFIVATFFVYPKICLHVFIGTRAAALSDGEQRSHMDTRKPAFVQKIIFKYTYHTIPETKVVNGVLIGLGVVLAATSGW